MSKPVDNNNAKGRSNPISGIDQTTDVDQTTDLTRRDALAKLGQFASAGYMAPALLTLLVSKKASALSEPVPPPPD
jgi:hypothetical protein